MKYNKFRQAPAQPGRPNSFLCKHLYLLLAPLSIPIDTISMTYMPSWVKKLTIVSLLGVGILFFTQTPVVAQPASTSGSLEYGVSVTAAMPEKIATPEPSASTTPSQPGSIGLPDTGRNTLPTAAALLMASLPFSATLVLATQFGWGLSIELLIRILQAIGLLPTPAPQGIVFDSDTEEPVPFAILNVTRSGEIKTTETLISAADGTYGGISLSPGTYQIEVRHQDFAFPTLKARPSYLTMYEFYKGEQFQIGQAGAFQLFMIPIDSINHQQRRNQAPFSWRLLRERFVRLSSILTLPFFVMSLVITVFFPTITNIIVTALYATLVIVKLVRHLKIPRIRGTVTDELGQPLQHVFVRCIHQESNQIAALLVTDEKGHFKAYIPKAMYQLTLTKPGYVWKEQDEAVQFYGCDVRLKHAVFTGKMHAVTPRA